MTTTGISLSDANTLSAATESCMKQQDAAEALGKNNQINYRILLLAYSSIGHICFGFFL